MDLSVCTTHHDRGHPQFGQNCHSIGEDLGTSPVGPYSARLGQRQIPHGMTMATLRQCQQGCHRTQSSCMGISAEPRVSAPRETGQGTWTQHGGHRSPQVPASTKGQRIGRIYCRRQPGRDFIHPDPRLIHLLPRTRHQPILV